MSQTKPQPSADLAARSVALDALIRTLDRKNPLDEALTNARGFSGLAPRDRAFARLLTATALRRTGETDALIDACIPRPLPAAARALRHVLALGICQILYIGTPPHAAVDTSVALAGRIARGRFRGLANAVLRRIVREGASLTAPLDAARLNTPDWLWQQWARQFGEATARAIAEAHLEEPPLDITPKFPGDAPGLAAELGALVLPTGSLRLPGAGQVTALPGFDDGKWWVQDAAAALPARLLGPVRGRRVLDLCAAPGGKTLQLAAAGGSVTAVDQSPARLARLAENLARTGLDAECVAGDARDFDVTRKFDFVLLDAPCTATGTLRRHPDIARTRGPDDALARTEIQDRLLAAAARHTAPGGRLVYAVCSLDSREGPERVRAFLAAHPAFRIEPVAASEIGGLECCIDSDGALRTLPCHLAAEGGMDGFYAARLRLSDEAGR